MEDGLDKPITNGGSHRNNKIPLEELDKEELIKRCKSYIALAQKAKSAKDDTQQRENDLLIRISSLEEKVSHLEEENCLHHMKAEEAAAEKSKLATELVNVTSYLKKKEEENEKLSHEIKELEANLASAEEKHEQQKKGFVEELNKMNVVLKQRGETITRLEEKYQLNEKEFKAKVETLLQSVAERERRIEQLEGDVNRLETQSEVMSTSTVSRAEEIHRMKDVEDSLEERYNKLKMLAVRMKKKMAEQTAQLAEKEKQLAGMTINGDDRNHPVNRNSIPLNLQALQKDIDRLNDELDSKKSQMTVLKKDCDNALQELVGSRQRAEEFKNEANVLRGTAAELEKRNKALEKSVQELQERFNLAEKEHETDKILRLELSKECDRLRNEIRNLNTIIEDLNRSQEAAKQESKKQALLQLEITDYEKTLAELNAQLDSLKKEQVAKQDLIERSDDEKDALLAQIKFLEQQVCTEQQRASESKMALDAIQSQLETYRSETEKQKTEIRQLTAKAESNGSEVDKLRLEISVVNGELQKARTGSAVQVESLRKRVAALEEMAAAEQSAKEKLERELSELQSEYEKYKRRATSILKKQSEGRSSCPPGGQPESVKGDDFNTDQVEREMLQRVVDALKIKITELESQLALAQGEITNMRMEKERLNASHLAASQGAQQRLERAESELEAAKREHQAQIARLQSDNQLLAALHRENIDGLKVRHAQELLALQTQLDAAAMEADRLQKVANQAYHRNASPLVKGDPTRDEVALVEKERGDGSDDGGSPSSRHRNHSTGAGSTSSSRRKPMPLDQLLDSSLMDECEVIQPSPVSPSAVSLEQYNESLSVAEKRCRHLAALLAESEANEARLSQLVDALKEEIRRAERSEERQKHIENLEYLKNVVLKFVTLPRGEERSRLIPVLTTLLRLSPAEVQQVHQTLNRSEGSAVLPTAWGGVFNYFAPNN